MATETKRLAALAVFRSYTTIKRMYLQLYVSL